MKNILSCTLLSTSILLLAANADAQQRFRAGLVLGLNASQILGDDIGGYNKLGLQGGLRVNTILRDKMDLIVEMLYSQRGSRSKTNEFIIPRKINLQYVEVPVMVSYKDWYIEDDDYYKVQVIGGLTYSRLFKSSAEGSDHDDQVDNFINNDVGFTLGAEFYLSRHFGFSFRFSRSINLLYNKDKHNPGVNSLRGFFLSFRTMYIF
ncbi:MAG: porin family protein [Saprospiraceae bacterium]